ncbi:hypothetical protein B5M44_10670 [Shinella sumterensis]|nr:hypothetical protein B5M44_10670 [Shinella sumterensis]
MPDQTILDAGKSITDVGVVGGVLILSWLALAWVVRTWRNDLDKRDALLAEERAAHQKTKDDQIADLRNLARVAEGVEKMHETLIAMAVRGEKA